MTQEKKQQSYSDKLYNLVDRLKVHSKWKYPERQWTTEFYYDVAFAWLGKEDELEKLVLKHEQEMKAAHQTSQP
jgi:hypothetical protein